MWSWEILLILYPLWRQGKSVFVSMPSLVSHYFSTVLLFSACFVHMQVRGPKYCFHASVTKVIFFPVWRSHGQPSPKRVHELLCLFPCNFLCDVHIQKSSLDPIPKITITTPWIFSLHVNSSYFKTLYLIPTHT